MIEELVKKIIDIYYQEDYDHMFEVAKSGEKLVGIETIEEEINYIKRNNLGNGLLEEDIKAAAEITLRKITKINKEIFKKVKIEDISNKINDLKELGYDVSNLEMAVYDFCRDNEEEEKDE